MDPTRKAFVAALLAVALAGCSPRGSRPELVAAAPEEPSRLVFRDVGGRELAAFVFRARSHSRGPAPAILLFHGGGWVAGGADWTFPRARRYARMGLVAIAIDYRLSDEVTTPVDALDDACEAFRWVRRNAEMLGIDPSRVAGHGVSAGGQLVAAAATRGCGSSEGSFGNGGPDALVLWSPALDVVRDGWFRRLLQGRADPVDYSPADRVPARMAPAIIVHGAEDTLTPVDGARRFCERAGANGNRCELQAYPGLGHLLTRNLANQEDDYDPDPVASTDGIARQERFLCELWLDGQSC